ncbi:MAG: trypsin-like peptidase domain-containing protein [Lachnospiraceae bacterium]|nr:trypsin-like peptidase domain-containing protein [Lachnospiraceae bacterium]
MYDDDFTGVNSPNVENKEYSNESTYDESATDSSTGSNYFNNSTNNYNSNMSSSYDSSVYNSGAYNSANNSNEYSNNAVNSYSSGNANSNVYNSSNAGNSAYNSNNASSNAYNNSNTVSNAYNSNNTGSSIYSNNNTVGSTYGSTGTTGSTYGHGAGTWGNMPYRQTGSSYQYGNTYPNSYVTVNNAEKKKKEKKEKKKREWNNNSYLKKALICVSLGLFFGICAGLGFYVVEAATGMLGNRNNNEQSVKAIEESSDADSVVSESVTYDIDGSDVRKNQTITTVVSDVSDVVKDVMPAVVSISNTYTERMSYFGQTMTSEAQASGSGIIVGKNDTELLIATNYHVIEDADKLTVQFVEDSEVDASVKGTDPDMDLAVIAVSLNDISSSTLDQIEIATLGDSDELTVGEPAIAIGNSLGYGQSVTTGVVSALNRELELSDGSKGTFIQTDAAINPGNSGGALLNIRGEVIGINSNKIGGSVIEGMGYSIPISAAKPIIAELMLKETKNKVAEDKRGFLGISGISVTAEVSSAYGMPEGVYIAQVYDGTAAAAAGLVKGDIITEFDGEKVSSMEELQTLLEYYAKGDTVEMTVMKVESGGYQSTTVKITLGNKVG